MILQGQFPIGLFDLLHSSSLGHSENFVVVVERIRVVLIEKFLFILINDPMLIEESLKGRVSIVK